MTTAINSHQKLFKNNLHIDIDRLNNFFSPIQVFAIWLNNYDNSFKKTNKIIDFFEQEIDINSSYISKTYTHNGIEKNFTFSKISAILSIEGAESIENNLDNLYHFYNRGVRILTLCWNYENNIGYGASTKSLDGLKSFGKDAIKEMNKLNMIIDTSHLNEAGFWDLYKLSKKPFIATHSNAYSICPHYRNLKDEQLKAIGDIGGIVGINLFPPFLSTSHKVNEYDIFKHIDHIEKIIGIDKICLGGDFDGISSTPTNISDVNGYNYLFDKILNVYGKSIMDKITYKNFYMFSKLNL